MSSEPLLKDNGANAYANEATQEGPSTGSYQTNMHLYEVSELGAALDTSLENGLTSDEAGSRLMRDGPNVLSPPKQKPEWLKFLLQFTNGFMILLMGASILSFVAYALEPVQQDNLYLGVVLFVVVVMTCTAGYYQEGKTGKVMELFKSMLPEACTVTRDGRVQTILASQLVVGDIVKIRGGEKCPADLRIISNMGLKTDTSSITGESDPIVAVTTPTPNSPPLESVCLVWNSSLVLDGSAEGVVIKTGDNTLIGSIASLASGGKEQPTLLNIEVNRFVKFITVLSICMASVFFIIGVARGPPKGQSEGENVLNVFVNGFIIIMVANVPQGLPSTVTSVLTVTAKKMALRSVFVKRLESVETLGSVGVICSDKTGTLTQNVMTVERGWTPSNLYSTSTDFIGAAGGKASHKQGGDPIKCLPAAPMGDLLFVAALNSRIAVQYADPTLTAGSAPDDAELILQGDATEKAIFRFSSLMVNMQTLRAGYQKVFEVPFNSKNKFQVTIHAPFSGSQRVLTFKGAPEIVFGRCSTYIDNEGNEQKIDDDFSAEMMRAQDRFGNDGERVLGFAMLPLPTDEYPPEYDSKYEVSNDGWTFPDRGFRFVGLLALCDPPRASVPMAVQNCHTAGIKVIMITGDHPSTALAIAKKVGIVRPEHNTIQDVMTMTQTAVRALTGGGVAPNDDDDDDDDDDYDGAAGTAAPIASTQSSINQRTASMISEEDFVRRPKVRFNRSSWNEMGSVARFRALSDLDPPQKLTKKQRKALMSTAPGAMQPSLMQGVQLAIDGEVIGKEGLAIPSAVDRGETDLGVIQVLDGFAAGNTVVTHPISQNASEKRVTLAPQPTVLPRAGVFDPRVTAAVIHGQDLEKMRDDEVDMVLEKQAIVFARTTPQQKLRIVTRIQHHKAICAMTGDGVNDSPALKKADVGVAMGIAGSAVTKEAADIILMDDDFASIVYGVQEGRRVFDNLKKTIAYTLSHLLSEMVPVMLALSVSMPQGFSSLCILMVDLGTELAPAIALSFEDAEPNIMQRPPRNPQKDRLVSLPLLTYAYLQAGVVHAIVGVLVYVWVFMHNHVPMSALPFSTSNGYFIPGGTANLTVDYYGTEYTFSPEEQQNILLTAQSGWFMSLVFGQFFHVFMCRTRTSSIFKQGIFTNNYVNVGVIIEMALCAFIIYFPYTHTFFTDGFLPGMYWAAPLITFVVLWSYNEWRKRMIRRYPLKPWVKQLTW